MQTEQLSKVAMHDLAQEHQPQPNISPYLLTVVFGELTPFYPSLFLSLSLHSPLSFPLGSAKGPLLFTW